VPDWSSLQFLWPALLLAGAGVPVFALFYAYKTRSVPPLLLCLGLVLLCAAMARPQTVWLSPVREATVMLVLDTSGSMRAQDLKPSRIEAAQQIAQQFVDQKPATLRVGLVTVAGTAALAQAPTEARDTLAQALTQLPLQYGSALGTGLLVALEALLPGAGIDAQKIINDASAQPTAPKAQDKGQSLDTPQTTPTDSPATAGRGRHMAIVLMSDGQSNMGPELLKMAELAASHEVKIHTVGMGTPGGDVVHMQGRSMRVKLEDEALQKVSAMTQGLYFKADSTEGLQHIHQQLGQRLRFEKRALQEVSAHVALLGMLFILLSAGRHWWRTGRII
jgi:Ca-activated chloride channel family protein